MLDDDIAVQAATWSPLALHGHAARLDDCDEVIHDSVGDRFVKDSFVSESL